MLSALAARAVSNPDRAATSTVAMLVNWAPSGPPTPSTIAMAVNGRRYPPAMPAAAPAAPAKSAAIPTGAANTRPHRSPIARNGTNTPPQPPASTAAVVAALPPTGDYQNDRLVNIGTNRWTFRAGLPTTVRLSPNWAPGKTTTFEILPSVDVYTPNNDPAFPEFSIRGRQVGSRLATVLAPDQTTQAPMGTLEMHLTHDLNKHLWVSLDSYSRLGGETSSDGQPADNQQAWTALGATIGGSPWSKARLSLTGGAVLAGNDNSPDGWQLRLQLQQSF